MGLRLVFEIILALRALIWTRILVISLCSLHFAEDLPRCLTVVTHRLSLSLELSLIDVLDFWPLMRYWRCQFYLNTILLLVLLFN